jgi:hypothetical protein
MPHADRAARVGAHGGSVGIGESHFSKIMIMAIATSAAQTNIDAA